MKAADALRAHILVAALESIPVDIEPALQKDAPAKDSSWSFSGMRLGVADLGIGSGGDFGGVNDRAWIDIDVTTARLLVPVLRTLIVDELRKLGVET